MKKVPQVLNDIDSVVNWNKCTVFGKKIEWLGFKLSKTGAVPVERKAETKLKTKRLENISDIRSLIGSMNQFIRFISHMNSSKSIPDSNGEKNMR